MLQTAKFKFKFNGIIVSLIFFVTTVLYSELILQLSINASLASPGYTVLFSAFIGALLAVIAVILPNRKISRISVTVLLCLSGTVFSLETALHRSFGYFYSIETVLGMGGAVAGSYGGTILQTILSILPFILLYQLPTLTYLFTVSKLEITSNRIKTACILIAFAILANNLSIYWIRRDSETVYLQNSSYDFNETAEKLGFFTALKESLLHSSNTVKLQITVDEDGETQQTPSHDSVKYNVTAEVQSFIEKAHEDSSIQEINRFILNRAPSEKNSKTGIFKGKNLIFVCAEALSPYAVTETFTPTLYKLTDEGINFTNYYSPTFGESTSGGEYTLLLSQIPKRTNGEKGMSMQLMTKNTIPYTLPALFRANGYICNGYHNNSYTYYGRNVTHPALGMNWYGCGGCITVDNDAEIFDLSSVLSSGWPRSDKELIEATAQKFIDASRQKQSPFFTYYLTVSGHSNYSFRGNRISAKNRHYTDTLDRSDTVKAYLAAQKELDLALESLINTLIENGILDDTVIVISNDHHPYGLSSTWAGHNGTDYLSELYEQKVKGKTDTEKGFLTIYCHGIEGETVTAPVSSLDVLPTVLNLFGIEYDSRIFCGKDAFAPGERLVFFSDGSFITDTVKYDRSARNTNTDKAYIEKITTQIRRLTQYSLAIRKNDYFSQMTE